MVKPADGGFYVLRNEKWHCQLCWKVADEGHVFSTPHRAKMDWHFRPGQPFPPSAPTWEPPPDPVWGVAAAGAEPQFPWPVPPPQPAPSWQVPPHCGQLQLTAGMPGPSQQLPVAAAAAAAQPPVLQPQPPLLQLAVAAEEPLLGQVEERLARVEEGLARVEELLRELLWHVAWQ